jgi:hypothetical protein
MIASLVICFVYLLLQCPTWRPLISEVVPVCRPSSQFHCGVYEPLVSQSHICPWRSHVPSNHVETMSSVPQPLPPSHEANGVDEVALSARHSVPVTATRQICRTQPVTGNTLVNSNDHRGVDLSSKFIPSCMAAHCLPFMGLSKYDICQQSYVELPHTRHPDTVPEMHLPSVRQVKYDASCYNGISTIVLCSFLVCMSFKNFHFQ